MTPEENEAAAFMFLQEQLSDTIIDISVAEQSFTVVRLAAFGLYRLQETRFHELLRFGGLNLDDPDVWDIVSGITTCFVTQDALILVNPTTPTLYDPEHDILKTFALDDPLQAFIDQMKFDGIMWRSAFFED